MGSFPAGNKSLAGNLNHYWNKPFLGRQDPGISSGASDIRIKVPEDAGVSIRFGGALTDTNLEELGWPRVDDRYHSPGYDKAAERIDLNMEMAVGRFRLEVLPAFRFMPGSGVTNWI